MPKNSPELSFRAQRGICFSRRAMQKQIPRAKNALGMTLLVGGLLVFVGSVVAQRTYAQATHTLKATPKTVAWGYYDAKATPVLRVKSGDTVEIQTLITNIPERLEKAGVPKDQVEQSLRDITEQVKD